MDIRTNISNLAAYKKAVQVEDTIHEYLKQKGYLRIDAPALSPALIPEGYLEVFETEFVYMQNREKLYLTPSPELFMKRLLVEGVGHCYYLGKSYRNSEPNSPKHLPEFTMLELYKVGASYKDIAEEVLAMLRSIAKAVQGDEKKLVYNGNEYQLDKWEEFTIAEVFQKYANIPEETLFNHEAFLKLAAEKGYVTDGFTYEDLFSQIYAQEIEPYLGKNGRPTVLFDYPKEFASLSKPNPDGRTAQRFEFYIDGIELGNCYGELTDWQEQEKRFHNEQKYRRESGKIEYPVDWGFIHSLKKGLPECSGIAIGVERLSMIFADVSSIEELQLISIQ